MSTSIIEGSPRGDWEQKQNDRHWQEDHWHNQEMQRHQNENARDWNDRQWRENQNHEQMTQQIEADVIMMFLNN